MKNRMVEFWSNWPAIFFSSWVVLGLAIYFSTLFDGSCLRVIAPWDWFINLDESIRASWSQVYAAILIALMGPFLFWQAGKRKVRQWRPVLIGISSEITDWYLSNSNLAMGVIRSAESPEKVIINFARQKLGTVMVLKECLQKIDGANTPAIASLISCFEAGNTLERVIFEVEFLKPTLEKQEIWDNVQAAMGEYGRRARDLNAVLDKH